MARTRNLKPAFFTNDKLAEVEPLGRLLFQGLWCHADREGRLLDRAKKLKAEILPYDDCDIEKLLTALAERGFIERYVVNEVHYIQVVTFTKHQRPHFKEGDSELPAPTQVGASQNSARNKSVLVSPLTLNPSSLTLNPQDGIPKSVLDRNAKDRASMIEAARLRGFVCQTGKT